MIDLTNYLEIQEPRIVKTYLTCFFRLDKPTMISILGQEKIQIRDKFYKVPEKLILQLLLDERYGEIKIDLEQL